MQQVRPWQTKAASRQINASVCHVRETLTACDHRGEILQVEEYDPSRAYVTSIQ